MAIPAVPVIGDLPPAPTRSDGPADFTPKADAMIGALQPLVIQINIALQWMNGRLTDAQAARDAAATSAGAAAGSATTASSYLADAQAARDGAINARNQAQVFAQASGASAGIPPAVANSFLGTDAAGNVLWKTIPEAFDLGDILTTARNPGAKFKRANGAVYLQSAYPDVFAKVGLISDMDRTQPTTVNLPSSSAWVGIAASSTAYVIVSANAAGLISADGITFTAAPQVNAANSIAYGNGKFVANAGQRELRVSSDNGATFQVYNTALPAGAGTWSKVRFINAKFFIFLNGTTTGASSTDGINWTALTLPSAQNWGDIAYGNSVYVLTTVSGLICFTSTDGVSWTQRSGASGGSIAFGSGLFAVIASTNIYYSENGITWFTATNAFAASALVFVGGVFVSTGGASVSISPDASTWTKKADVSGNGGNWSNALVANNVVFSPAQGGDKLLKWSAFSYDIATQFRFPYLPSYLGAINYIKVSL